MLPAASAAVAVAYQKVVSKASEDEVQRVQQEVQHVAVAVSEVHVQVQQERDRADTLALELAQVRRIPPAQLQQCSYSSAAIAVQLKQ